MSKRQFKAESKKLLDLMINSIYTNKEIFLRELISNASDALDKLYYESLTNKKLKVDKKKLFVKLKIDKEKRLLTIEDNGIGMSDEKIRELFSEDPGEKQKNRSIGIFNIHKRMQYLYGESYGVKIKSEPEKGTVVFLEIPRKKQGENQNACKKL